MSRMRINGNPLVAHRARVAAAVNEHFNRVASENVHRDAAHKAKREVAALVRSGTELADDHPFMKEASLRGLPAIEFANDILAKPDNVQARELKRQKVLLAIAAAQTPAEIEEITKTL